MPVAFLFLSLLWACGDDADTSDAEAFCSDLASRNEGCWTDELDAECRELHAECGTDILVMESCPVQLGCS